VEQREPSYTIGGNVNWYNHYGKQYGGTSENYRTTYVTQQSHSWAYIQTKLSLKKTHVQRKSSLDSTFLHYVILFPQQKKLVFKNKTKVKKVLSALKKKRREKDTRTHMFTAALFTTDKTWKQPKCLLEMNRLRRSGIYTQ